MPAGTDRTQDGGLKAKVFISYSRKDMAFTDRLETALRAHGFEPFIDRTEIYAFEDWWKRIEALIGKADTVIFILSPDAVASSVCHKEVEYAAALNKRFAPIVCRQVDAQAVPEPLRRFNFIFFTDETKFDESTALLAQALSTDIDWVRKHTEFGAEARRWAQAGRPGPRGILLRSPALEEAERWIATRPQNAPMPTEDVLAFIAESRRAATRRRNIVSGTLAAGMLVALVLMGLAYWQRSVAIEQRNKALVTQSRFLADQANQLTRRGDQTSAALVALEGLPDPSNGSDRPLVPEAKAALYGGLNASHELAVLTMPGTSITGLGASNDRRRLATTQKNGTIAVWDAATTRLLGVYGPFANISFVIFDAPGDRLVISDKSGKLHVIDALTGADAALPPWERKVAEMFGQILDLSTDWTRVILAKPRAIATIDTTTGLVQSTVPLEGAEGENDLHFLGRDRIINSKGDVWDSLTGKRIAHLPVFDAENAGFTGVGANRDGSMIAFGGYDASARVFDVATQKLLFKAKHPESRTIKGHERDQATVYDVAFSPDGNLLATASADASVRIWDVRSHQLVAVLLGHAGPVRSVGFLPDGRRLVTLSDDGTVRIWTWISTNEVIPRKPYADGVIRAFIRHDAVWLITYVDHSVVVWDFTHDKIVAKLSGPSPAKFWGPTSRAFVNPEGTRLIASVSNESWTAWVWDLTNGKLLSRIDIDRKAPGSEIADVGLSADGRLAFVASSNLLIWDVDNNKLLKRITPDANIPDPAIRHVDCASFSPDSREIATASLSANGLEIWDVHTGARKRQLKNSAAGCARFSPDGRRILGYEYEDESAYVIDAQTGQTISVLRGHTHFIDTAEFSPNGRFVATSSEDSTMRVWDAGTGEQLLLLTDVGGILWGQFSPDSTHILTEAGGPSQSPTGDEPWRARVWPIFTNAASMVDDTKKAAPRCLTEAQRQKYFLDPDPPPWCIEMGKWPYQSQDWKDWLRFKRANANPPLPDSAGWKDWIAAHR